MVLVEDKRLAKLASRLGESLCGKTLSSHQFDYNIFIGFVCFLPLFTIILCFSFESFMLCMLNGTSHLLGSSVSSDAFQ